MDKIPAPLHQTIINSQTMEEGWPHAITFKTGLDAKKRNRRFWCGFAQPLRMLIKPPHLEEKESAGVSPGKR